MARKRNPLADFVIGAADAAKTSVPAALNLYATQGQRDLTNVISIATLMNNAQTNYSTQLKNYRDSKILNPNTAGPEPQPPPILNIFSGQGTSNQSTTIPDGSSPEPSPNTTIDDSGSVVPNSNTSTQPLGEVRPLSAYEKKVQDLTSQYQSGYLTTDKYNEQIKNLELKPEESAQLDAYSIFEQKLGNFLDVLESNKDKLGAGKFSAVDFLGIHVPSSIETGKTLSSWQKQGGIPGVIGNIGSNFVSKPTVGESELQDAYREAVDALAVAKAGGKSQVREGTKQEARNEFPDPNQDWEYFLPDARGFLKDYVKTVDNYKAALGDKNLAKYTGIGDSVRNNQYLTDVETTDFTNPLHVQDMIHQRRITPAEATNGINNSLKQNPEVPETIEQRQLKKMGPSGKVTGDQMQTPTTSTQSPSTLNPIEQQIKNMIDAGTEVPGDIPENLKQYMMKSNVPGPTAGPSDSLTPLIQKAQSSGGVIDGQYMPSERNNTQVVEPSPLEQAKKLRLLLGLPVN